MSCNAAPVGEVTRPMVCGKGGSGFLVVGVEESFRLELALERLEPCLQRAQPFGLDDLDDELILSARLVDRQVAEHLHLHAVGQHGPGGQGRRDPAKQHAGKLRAVVLEP